MRFVQFLFFRHALGLFYALKQNYCFPQGHTGLSYFQTAQIDRGALCLNKISPVSQCIMDVEQFL